MTDSLTLPLIYWLPPLLAGCTTAILALVIASTRPSRSAVTLVAFLLSTTTWSMGYCLQLRSLTLKEHIFWSKVEYVGPAGVSLAGLIFVLQYAGFNKWVRTSRILMLAALPAVTLVLVWTNERHRLIWRRLWLESTGPYNLMARTHGPWFWIFLGYGDVLCLIAIGLLIREFLSRRGIYRSQAAVMLIASLFPFVSNLMYSFSFNIVPNLDFTPFAFSITGVSLVWGFFRFQLPVIMPVARKTVFEGMTDAVIAIDPNGNVVEVNPEASRVLGQTMAQLIGKHASTAFALYPALADFCTEAKEVRGAIAIDRLSSARRFDARRSLLTVTPKQVIGSLIVLHDITEREAAENALRRGHSELEQRVAERTSDLSRTIEALTRVQNELTFSASHDSLTGLANRKLFLDQVARRLTASGLKSAHPFAILYLDLDRFKVYNDGYGHHVGDLILVEMGRRICSCFGPLDVAARMGGDEFTVLLEKVESADEASGLANECLRALNTAVSVGNGDIHLTASIGISVGSGEALTPQELLRDADLAMYRAKRQGGNQAVFFGESMRSSALSLVQLEQDLHSAVSRNEIVVQYQPFVRIKTGKVLGFEALVRWRHPGRGLLQPTDFLPLAEQTGALMAIDEFVLREACRQKACWDRVSRSDSDHPFVSVNVSGWQFSNPERWWELLSRLVTDTDGLRLEMVESVLVENAHAAVEFFEQVRAHNLQIYLDDFGTGYSSLSWLSHFPIRSLKIDRSFVKGITGGGKDISIVRAIIALASSLDMGVVAEGVECGEQSAVLQDLGCEYGQGFYFSPPVDGPETLAMVS